MSYTSVKAAVSGHVGANFGTTYSLLPENTAPPSDRTKPWVRFSIRPGDSRAMDVGSTYRRRTGLIWFQVFIPENKGTEAATLIGDNISTMLDDQRLTTTDGMVRIGKAELNFVGPEPTGYQLWRVVVPYTDEYLA